MPISFSDLEFEDAARLRDEISRLESAELGLPGESAKDVRERQRALKSGARSSAGRPGTRVRRGKTNKTTWI